MSAGVPAYTPEPARSAAAGYLDRVTRYVARPRATRHAPSSSVGFAEFRQRVRKHKPSELLPELATLACIGGHELPPTNITAKFSPWAIATTARESVLWSNEHRHEPVTDDTLRRLFNAHGQLVNPGPEVVGDDWALDTMIRLSYEQFMYQESTFKEVARPHVLMIEGAAEIDMEVLDDSAWSTLFGAPFGEIVGATFFLQMAALSDNGYFNPTVLERGDLQQIFERWPVDTIRLRAEQLSSTFNEFRDAYNDVPHPPKGYERFAFNPLTRRPFLRMPDGRLLAPQPRLILQTVSPGALFYAGKNAFGPAFARDLGGLTEHYVGKLLRPIADQRDDIELHPEIVYRNDKNDELKSIDWFLVLPGLVVMFEVKSARFGLLERAAFGEYRTRVSALFNKAITQLTRSSTAMDDGHTDFAPIPTDRPRIGITVTCEPHYLANSHWVRDLLNHAPMPTLVASLSEIEDLTVLPAHEIEAQLLAIVNDPDRSTWNLGNAIDDRDCDHNPILQRAWDAYPWPTDLDDEIDTAPESGTGL